MFRLLIANSLSTLPSNAFAGLSQVTNLFVLVLAHAWAPADALIGQATIRQQLDNTASRSIRWFESVANSVSCVQQELQICCLGSCRYLKPSLSIEKGYCGLCEGSLMTDFCANHRGLWRNQISWLPSGIFDGLSQLTSIEYVSHMHHICLLSSFRLPLHLVTLS